MAALTSTRATSAIVGAASSEAASSSSSSSSSTSPVLVGGASSSRIANVMAGSGFNSFRCAAESTAVNRKADTLHIDLPPTYKAWHKTIAKRAHECGIDPFPESIIFSPYIMRLRQLSSALKPYENTYACSPITLEARNQASRFGVDLHRLGRWSVRHREELDATRLGIDLLSIDQVHAGDLYRERLRDFSSALRPYYKTYRCSPRTLEARNQASRLGVDLLDLRSWSLQYPEEQDATRLGIDLLSIDQVHAAVDIRSHRPDEPNADVRKIEARFRLELDLCYRAADHLFKAEKKEIKAEKKVLAAHGTPWGTIGQLADRFDSLLKKSNKLSLQLVDLVKEKNDALNRLPQDTNSDAGETLASFFQDKIDGLKNKISLIDTQKEKISLLLDKIKNESETIFKDIQIKYQTIRAKVYTNMNRIFKRLEFIKNYN